MSLELKRKPAIPFRALSGWVVTGHAYSDEWAFIGSKWVRMWLAADVGANVRRIALQIRIVGNARVWLDDISVDLLDGAAIGDVKMAVQRELAAMYVQLDKSYAGNSPAPKFLVNQPLALPVPTFQHRADDIKVLSRPGVKLV